MLKLNDCPVSLVFGIGTVPLVLAMTFLLFTKLLSFMNVIVLICILELPLICLILKKQIKFYNPLVKLTNIERIIFFLLFICSIIFFLSSFVPIPFSDHYRWEALHRFIDNSGYIDISYDYRNVVPFYSEMILLVGIVLRGDTLALMINNLFPILITVGVFENKNPDNFTYMLKTQVNL